MKIITDETYLEQEIFALTHLFMQDTELDDNKPYIYFNMNLVGVNLFVDFTIEFEDDTIKFQNTVTINKYKSELEQKRYVKRAVKNQLYNILSKKLLGTLSKGTISINIPFLHIEVTVAFSINKVLFLSILVKQKPKLLSVSLFCKK